jgi:methyl-accepting chemotaxis protein
MEFLGYAVLKKKIIQQSQQKINLLEQEISLATDFIQHIESGNLDYELKVGDNELSTEAGTLGGALVSMRDQMKKIAESEQERKWATEGLAKFVDILRASNEDINQLGDKIIANLVKYLDAKQGGLFVVNETGNGQVLELLACYAYERKKYVHKTIAPGEGLVGQCLLEKDTIYLTEVPENYVNITSGLGLANPRSILMVPLKLNEEVYGIIELASFHKFKKYQIEFIEKLAESIASTISTVKINEATKKLLSESQEQSEMLRSQEEEMRQNLEELQATQEEMQRKTVDIESRLNALNNSGVAIIQFTLDGIIEDANVSFLKLMKYSLEEIKGKHDRIFVDTAYAKSPEYGQFWSDIKNGINKNGEYERIAKDGTHIYTLGTYSFLYDIHGNPIKALKIATDITTTKNLMLDFKQQAEELKAADEEMKQQVEEMHAIQEELAKKKDEVEEIRKTEKERADTQIASQKKMMEQFVAKTKENEAQLKKRIEELESKK